MSCFRFKAIMHPLNQQTSKKTTLALLLMAWFFALALAIPKMMVYKFTIVYDSAYGLKPYCMTKDLEMEWPSWLENLMATNSTLNSTKLNSTLKSDSILEWFWLCSFILKSKAFLVCTMVGSNIWDRHEPSLFPWSEIATCNESLGKNLTLPT